MDRNERLWALSVLDNWAADRGAPFNDDHQRGVRLQLGPRAGEPWHIELWDTERATRIFEGDTPDAARIAAASELTVTGESGPSLDVPRTVEDRQAIDFVRLTAWATAYATAPQAPNGVVQMTPSQAATRAELAVNELIFYKSRRS